MKRFSNHNTQSIWTQFIAVVSDRFPLFTPLPWDFLLCVVLWPFGSCAHSFGALPQGPYYSYLSLQTCGTATDPRYIVVCLPLLRRVSLVRSTVKWIGETSPLGLQIIQHYTDQCVVVGKLQVFRLIQSYLYCMYKTRAALTSIYFDRISNHQTEINQRMFNVLLQCFIIIWFK